jgi:hypothetical protein
MIDILHSIVLQEPRPCDVVVQDGRLVSHFGLNKQRFLIRLFTKICKQQYIFSVVWSDIWMPLKCHHIVLKTNLPKAWRRRDILDDAAAAIEYRSRWLGHLLENFTKQMKS